MAIQTLGEQFRSLCFVGLDRVEYHPEEGDQAIFADSWSDVSDEQSRKTMGLAFFAPRDLNGEPVNPYAYLAAEQGLDGESEESIIVTQHALSGVPLLDMCRIPPAEPNTVNILIAADIIFHWDMKDNYIQPTSQLSWVRDLKAIIKDYPRTTKVTIYTDWQSEQLYQLRLEHLPVSELPFTPQVWLNKPAMQEKYGTHILLGAALLAGAVYMGISHQHTIIDDLNTQIRQVEAATPKGGNSTSLEALISDQEEQMEFRQLIPLTVKDVAAAIQNSEMKAKSFEVRNTNPKEPPSLLLATIEAAPKAYTGGWLQEEPVAKKLLAHSVSMVAVRKPPMENRFKLEALIDLPLLADKRAEYQAELMENREENILPDLSTNAEAPTEEETE